MKKNFKAWHIESTKFTDKLSDIDKLLFFSRYAILAPSGHNTQPWLLKKKKDSIILFADDSRLLPYSGIQANEPYVSLGSFIGVLELAAKAYGYELKIIFYQKDNKIAEIKILGKVNPDRDLIKAITSRVSNRNLYKKKSIPDKTLKKIIDRKIDKVYYKILTKNNEIDFIANQTTQATHKIMSDSKFRLELSKWVRNNNTRKHDGMPGYVQGIPTPISMIAKHVIKRFNVSKDQAKKDSRRILNTPCLIIVGVKTHNKHSLVNAGRFFSSICVLAQKEGIDTTGLGAAIIDPVTTSNVIQEYSLPGKPIAIIRLGYANKKAKLSPRWPLKAILQE